jgi:acyl carrier protein
MNFVDLFNAVARIAKPMHPDFDNAKSLDDKLPEIDVDSLDTLMICIYMSEIYGVEEEVAKTMQPATVGDIHAFLMEHKTREPESVEAAIELIK